jgi:hypothetical protein
MKKKQLHIINEVRKYSKQKKILEKLSSIYIYIYIEDEFILQNKSMDDLVIIYNKSINALQNYVEQITNLRDMMNTIKMMMMMMIMMMILINIVKLKIGI